MEQVIAAKTEDERTEMQDRLKVLNPSIAQHSLAPAYRTSCKTSSVAPWLNSLIEPPTIIISWMVARAHGRLAAR